MWRRLSAGGGLTASWQRGCLPDEQCLVTGSCLMSKSLLKLLLVCAEFDPKAQPDTLAHWSLIDVSVFTVCYRRSDMKRQSAEPGLGGVRSAS